MPKKFAAPFPRTISQSRRYLYLIGAEDGSVKVGITCTPRDRLKTLRLGFAAEVSWYHFFPAMAAGDALSAEHSAKCRLGEIGERVRRTETYRDVTKGVAIATVREVLRSKRDCAAEAYPAYFLATQEQPSAAA